MFVVAIIIFLGLTINAKTGLDRWIYSAFTAATVWGAIYFQKIPWLSGWFF